MNYAVEVDCMPVDKEKYPRLTPRNFSFDLDAIYWMNLGLLYYNREGNELYWYRKAR